VKEYEICCGNNCKKDKLELEFKMLEQEVQELKIDRAAMEEEMSALLIYIKQLEDIKL
tara:strand:+ start:908 stop:1081 length:174 start_codon:yes stop_codon:yes gene_type:complete